MFSPRLPWSTSFAPDGSQKTAGTGRVSTLRTNQAALEGASLPGHKLVFIGGLHRSGTSLLAQCLGRHPSVSSFQDTGVIEDEGQFLQTVYPKDTAFGGPGRMGFDDRAYGQETSPLVTPENRAKLIDEWSRHWDMDKTVLVEKTPRNLLQARFLQALFPDAYFIMIRRHPIAVSLATQKWTRMSWLALMEHWLTCHERFATDKLTLNRVLEIRYEDLVGRTGETLTHIADFLSIPPWIPNIGIKKDINAHYFGEWRRITSMPNYYLEGFPYRVRAAHKIVKKGGVKQQAGFDLVDMNADALAAISSMEDRVQKFGYSLRHLTQG